MITKSRSTQVEGGGGDQAELCAKAVTGGEIVPVLPGTQQSLFVLSERI
jgi:hypothetical protein